MKTKTTWTLLLGLATVLAGAGLAAGQDAGDGGNQTDVLLADQGQQDQGQQDQGLGQQDAGFGDQQDDIGLGEEQRPADMDFTVDAELAADDVSATTCSENGGGDGLAVIPDRSMNKQQERSVSQDVNADEDDILLAIALANNGADDITWDRVSDMERTREQSWSLDKEADFEREDVFSALALGVDADGGQLQALACVSDMQATATATTTESREVDLEEENVLLAIALSNSIGSELNYNDVVDFTETQSTELDVEVDSTVDREDTFLALALGAGGEDGGS